jgi:hypothetical protein
MASGPEGYDTGGIDRPSRSPMIVPVEFSGQERLDLVVFMQTLTGVAEGEPAPKLPVCHPRAEPHDASLGTARRALGASKMSFEENLPHNPFAEVGQTGHGAGRLCRGLMERGSAPRNAPEPSDVSAVAHLRKVDSNGSDQTKGSLRWWLANRPTCYHHRSQGPGSAAPAAGANPGCAGWIDPASRRARVAEPASFRRADHPATQAIGSVLL